MELMVVVAIIAILAVTVVSEFLGTREEAQLRSSASRLVMALHLGYSQAVTTGRTHRVRLRPEERRFWLEARGGDGDGGEFAPVTHLPRSGGTLPGGIALEVYPGGEPSPRQRRLEAFSAEREIADTIHFRPDGTADGKRIRLRDRQGFGLELTIDSTTSRVRLTEFRGKRARES